jgi:uncharacterized protein (UPF0333 family)
MIYKWFKYLLKDRNGQLSLEYILVMGVIILVVLSFFPYVYEINELNTCMAVARNGALEGALMDSFAVYSQDKYEFYMKEHPRLKSGTKVFIVKIDYEKLGFDSRYKKNKIKIRVYASASSLTNPEDRNCAGDRINYNVRKDICEAFKTENLTNIYYDPAFSDRYFFTTAEVNWI